VHFQKNNETIEIGGKNHKTKIQENNKKIRNNNDQKRVKEREKLLTK
jgi:hypothetical protein